MSCQSTTMVWKLGNQKFFMQMYSSHSDDPLYQVVEHGDIKPTTAACAAFNYWVICREMWVSVQMVYSTDQAFCTLTLSYVWFVMHHLTRIDGQIKRIFAGRYFGDSNGPSWIRFIYYLQQLLYLAQYRILLWDEMSIYPPTNIGCV